MPTRVTFPMTNCTSCGRELSAGGSEGRSLCPDYQRTDLPSAASWQPAQPQHRALIAGRTVRPLDRKSTRLNSSHANISYAVFCLKKKKNTHSLNLSRP